MKGRGDVPLRPSCAVIILRHRHSLHTGNHGFTFLSLICKLYLHTENHGFVFLSLICEFISSHGKSRISTEGLCHEICESFFFTRKVTDVPGRFMSRDCESFFFTQQVTDVSGSLVKEKSVTSRDIPCEKKKRRPNILFLFSTTKVRK